MRFMNKISFATIFSLFLLILPLKASDLSVGIIAGYNGGTGFQINGEIGKFAKGFPFGAQLSIGYISLNPGIALDARKVFINDATNGDPEKFGRVWDIRFDFPYQLKRFKKSETSLFLGPRYAMFNGRFNFIGGNEDFEVKSESWGFGTGVKSLFEISERLALVVSFGGDYYLNSAIYSHGTTYSPDGEHVDPRKEFEYEDADAAVNQPKYKVHSLIGFQYRF